jgi:nitrogen fixation NifU-like protein
VISVDEELIEHMSRPNNYGRIEDYSSMGIGENPENGEKVLVYLDIIEQDGEPFIKDIKFEAIACMTTVVAGSIITSEAKEITFSTAEELIAVTLGMLESVPPAQAACSEMVAVALKAAIDGYSLSKESGKKETLIYKIEQSCSPELQFTGEETK